MQFYARFQDEVVADPAAIAAHVERAREQVSPAFAAVFDEALVHAHERLVAEPRGPGRQGPLRHPLPPGAREHPGADRVPLRHRLPRARRAAARLRRGLQQIHHDEQRHIGYGVWYLREAVARDPELGDEVRATLGGLLPAVAESLTPPDRDGTDWDALGASARRSASSPSAGSTAGWASSASRSAEPAGQLVQRARHHVVVRPQPLALGLDDAGVAKHLEVMRDRRLARSNSGTSSHTQTLPACLRSTSTSCSRTGSAIALASLAIRSASRRSTSG